MGFGAFWEGLGRLWGGFGQSFGRFGEAWEKIWGGFGEGLGRIGGESGLVSHFAGFGTGFGLVLGSKVTFLCQNGDRPGPRPVVMLLEHWSHEPKRGWPGGSRAALRRPTVGGAVCYTPNQRGFVKYWPTSIKPKW